MIILINEKSIEKTQRVSMRYTAYPYSSLSSKATKKDKQKIKKSCSIVIIIFLFIFAMSF